MISLAVVLTCTVREPVPAFLPRTLYGLDCGGADLATHKVVYSDGPLVLDQSATVYRPWEILSNNASPPDGVARSLWSIFQLAIDRNVDRLFFFEDDISSCINAFNRMYNTSIPNDVAWASFCHIGEARSGPHVDGKHKISLFEKDSRAYPNVNLANAMGGHHACVFPRRTIEMLIQKLPQLLGGHALPIGCRISEELITDTVRLSNTPRYLLHMPSLFKHAGVSSTRENTEGMHPPARESHYYAGDIFDALTLTF